MRTLSLMLCINAMLLFTAQALHEKTTDKVAVEALSAACQKRQTNNEAGGQCTDWEFSPLNGPPAPFPCGCLDDDKAGGCFPGTGKKETANTEQTNFVDYTIGVNPPAGFDSVAGFAFTDNTREIFVVAKAGQIFHVDMNTEAITLFMDLTSQVHNVGDYGMLSVETHTDFANNPFVYASYVNSSLMGSNSNFNTISFVRVMRIKSVNGQPAESTYIIGRDYLDSNPLCSSSHAGGALAMGHDGSLFITLGEGSHFDTDVFDYGQTQKRYPLSGYCGVFFPGQNMGALKAQSKDSLGGKVIRVDPSTGEGICSSAQNNGQWSVYNPYCSAGIDLRSPKARIYAMGFRNPFSMNVRPYRDGDPACGVPYVGDVGLGSFEEVNAVSSPGLNFGWPCWEGPQPMGGYRDSPYNNLEAFPEIVRPVNDDGQNFSCPWVYNNVETKQPTYYWSRYTHDMDGLYGEQYVLGAGFTGNCVSGVAFYTGTSYPAQFQNQVFFSDYGAQWIKSFTTDQQDDFTQQNAFQSLSVAIVDLEINPYTKDLCYLELLAGVIHCFAYASGNQPPVIDVGSDVTAGALPLTVQFNADNTYDRDGSAIKWMAWDFGDGSASSLTVDPNPSHTYTTAGVYTATLHVNNGYFTTNKSIVINAGHVPPKVTITKPTAGQDGSFSFAFYNSSLEEPIDFSGYANQATGDVTYLWDVYMVHTNHYHPQSYINTQASFSTDQDSLGASSHIGERINFLAILTATDSKGVTGQSYVRLSEMGWTSNKPVPSFTYSPDTISAGQPVRFDASASYDIDLDTITYLWDFGDGHSVPFTTLSPNKYYTHSFSKPGLYTIKLLAMDNWGANATVTELISVTAGYVQNPPTINLGEQGGVVSQTNTAYNGLTTAATSAGATTAKSTKTDVKDPSLGSSNSASTMAFSAVLVALVVLLH